MRSTETGGTDVQLRCGDLEAVVRPEFGGQVSSLRCRGRELLDRRTERGTATIDAADYVSGGLTGIDDCLPAIAPGTHPARRALIPDHGELWCRPAEVLERGGQRVVLQSVGERLPFSLRRAFALQSDALRVQYAIEHLSEGELPLLWAAHPLLAPSPGMRIDLPTTLKRVESASDGVGLTEDGRLRTPSGDCDPGDWDAIPERTHAKLFGPWGGPVSVVHSAWGMTLTIALQADRPAHLGLWLNRGGFPAGSPSSHVAVEPTFGDSDALDAAMASSSCLLLGPHERASWTVTYSLA